MRTDDIISYIEWLRQLKIPGNIDTLSVQWCVRRSSHCNYLKHLAPDHSFIEVLRIASDWIELKELEIVFERDLPCEGNQLFQLKQLLYDLITRLTTLRSFRVVSNYVPPVVTLIQKFFDVEIRPVRPNLDFYFGYSHNFY